MGLPAGIQPDFGRFDPKFLGITLRVGSRRAHELLREAEQVNPEQIESESPELAFETLALLTVLVHETRHFHDFLLAPFGGLVTRRRFAAFLNARQALGTLLGSGSRPEGNVLPVPFQVWCLMHPEARVEEASYWNLGDDQVLALPDAAALKTVPQRTEWRPTGPDLFHDQVALTLAQYRLLDQTFASFAPYDMSEGSALLVQAQEIWRAFGEEGADLFLATLQEHSASPYGRALRLLSEVMAATDSELHSERMSEIATWAILGDVFKEGEKASSLERFGLLARHLIADGYPAVDLGVADLFARWDAATGCSSTFNGVRSALEWDDNFAQQLESNQRRYPETTVLGEVAEMFEMFRSARRTMVESFLASPESYVYPERYREAISGYLRPPVLLEFEGGVLEVPEDSPFKVIKAREGKDGRRYASVVGLPYKEGGSEAIDLSRALQLRDEIAVADVLFAANAPDPIDWEICKTQFEHYGFLVRQVIS